MDRISVLAARAATTTRIADALNREGFSPLKRRCGFFPDLVRQRMLRRGVARSERSARMVGTEAGRSHPGHGREARQLARRGWGRSRRMHERHLWIQWADESELIRLRQLAASSHRGIVKNPAELITPKRLGHG
jgi:hypothetical protein